MTVIGYRYETMVYMIGWRDGHHKGVCHSKGICSIHAVERFQRAWMASHTTLPEEYWVALCPECLTGHRYGGCR